MGLGMGILGIVLWVYGFLMMALSCMVGICGPYIASYMLILSIVTGQF